MSTLLPVQFQALDEGADPKAQQPGVCLVANNCRMDKARRLGKRRGTTALSKGIFSGGFFVTANRLISRGADVGLANGFDDYIYSSDLSAWTKAGHTADLRITKRGLVDTTGSAATCDTVAYGNLLVTVFVAGSIAGHTSSLFVKVENADTGAVVLPPLLISDAGIVWSRVRISGTDAIIAYSFDFGTGVGGVSVQKLSLTTLTLGIGQTLDSGVPVTPGGPMGMDIMTPAATGVPTMFVAYSLSSGTNRLRIGSWNVSAFAPVLSPVDFATTSQNVTCINVACAANKMHVIYNLVGIGIQILSMNWNSTSQVVTTESVGGSSFFGKYASINVVDATNLLVAVSGSDSAAATPFRLTTYLTSIAAHTKVASSERITWQAIAHVLPWSVAGTWYTLATLAPKDNSLITNTSIPNATSVILEIETTDSITSVQDTPLPHVGTAENLTAWQPLVTGHISQAAIIGTNVYVPAPYRNREPLNFQNIPVGFDLYKIQTGGGDNHRLALAGRGGLVACGAPYWYDGTSTRRYGFAHAPMIVGLTAAAGGAQAAGTYTYVAVYEWRDGNNVLHRSIPSPPRSVTITASQQVTVAVTTSAVSQKQGPPYYAGNAGAANPVSIAIYRTEANGSVYYRLTLEPDYQVLVNDPTVGSVSLVDKKADSDIGGGSPARPLNTQPQLYTGASGTGGALEDVPPPAFQTVTTWKGRLVGLDGTSRSIWFTKDSTSDTTVAPGFNEALVRSFASDKVAFASLSETLVVFGTNDIDVVHSEGPDNTGGNGDWQIQRVQSDIGCVNPKSIVTTPMGAMFQSQRGLELLDTGLSLTWVGKAVEDTLAKYPVVTSAVLCAADHEVRFTCSTVDGTSGVVVAWDYASKFWFTRSYTDTADTGNTSVAFVDALLIGGVYTMLTATGRVYQETTTSFLDGGTAWVTTDIQLAWISPWTPGGRGRFKDATILGTSKTAHLLEVSTATNYADWETPKVFPEGSLATTPGASKARKTFTVQKGQAGRIRLRDLPPATANYGTGEGPIFEGLVLRVQQKGGPVKTAAEEQG